VREAAFGCDWVGTATPFQRCLVFITATANKGFQLTAGKFVPVSNVTMMNVCMYVFMYVCMNECMCVYVCMYICVYVRMKVCIYLYIYTHIYLVGFDLL